MSDIFIAGVGMTQFGKQLDRSLKGLSGDAVAQAFADAAATAGRLGGVDVRTIHIVGGGALNRLLCQRTADRAGMPVLAGPVEATALGNVLVQARAAGFVSGSLEALRDLVARTHAPRRFDPVA